MGAANHSRGTAATTASGAPYLAVDATHDDEPAILMRQTSDRGVIDFLLQSPGEVSIHLRGRVEPSDLRAYFMGPVLGHPLRLRRTTAGGAAARRSDMAAIDSLCRSVPVYRASLPASFPWLRRQSLALLESLTG